jgi:hypothetical protein
VTHIAGIRICHWCWQRQVHLRPSFEELQLQLNGLASTPPASPTPALPVRPVKGSPARAAKLRDLVWGTRALQQASAASCSTEPTGHNANARAALRLWSDGDEDEETAL